MEAINLFTHFSLVDVISSYNFIMDRPLIHQMHAVPSSYHQTFKFQTKWGIKEIKGYQKSYLKCYHEGFKKLESS